MGRATTSRSPRSPSSGRGTFSTTAKKRTTPTPCGRWASRPQPDAEGNIDQSQLPTLVLPVDKKVTIDLQSRDVIHSFWIIDFLYKKDMFIGKDNSWSFIPTREGEYAGKCAELCGEYHSMMLFNVKVVSQDDYDAYLESLEEKGNTGDITDAYDRPLELPGDDPRRPTPRKEGSKSCRTTEAPRTDETPQSRPTTLARRQAALMSSSRVEQKGNIVVKWITSTDHKTIG